MELAPKSPNAFFDPLGVFTDFKSCPMVSVEPTCTLATAHDDMEQTGARALVVTQQAHDGIEQQVIDYDSVHKLTSGALFKLVKASGQTHLIVVEPYGDGSVLARGLIFWRETGPTQQWEH